MANYIVLFEDNDDKALMRDRHMPEHLGFLESHAGAIAAAGPLYDTESGEGSGGLWMVRADNPSAVWGLVP